jgi:metal-responsive CopG/Arc/MetJ family transcriptional regulator
MSLLKRTYSLPPETIEQFEQAVAPGQRSSVIADLLRAWLETRRRERLRREVIEGCHAMAEIYLQTEREFHPLEEEVHRALLIPR